MDDDEPVGDEGPFGTGFNPFFGFQPPPAGPPEEEEGGDVAPPCGFICQILRSFEAQIRQVQEDIDEVRRKQQEKENEIDDDDDGEGESGEDDGFDVHNSTYTEKVRTINCSWGCKSILTAVICYDFSGCVVLKKNLGCQVLPDGTVVKVNRTVISDTGDDGTSFFFHSTSFHNVQSGAGGDGEEKEEDKGEEEEEEREVADENDYGEYEGTRVEIGDDDGDQFPLLTGDTAKEAEEDEEEENVGAGENDTTGIDQGLIE